MRGGVVGEGGERRGAGRSRRLEVRERERIPLMCWFKIGLRVGRIFVSKEMIVEEREQDSVRLGAARDAKRRLFGGARLYGELQSCRKPGRSGIVGES